MIEICANNLSAIQPIFLIMFSSGFYIVILLFYAAIFQIALLAILLLIKVLRTETPWLSLIKIFFLLPFVLIVVPGIILTSLFLVADFCTTPMTVRKRHLQGDFIVNRDLFKGPNADWQYDHYWFRIEDDTLTLNIMDQGELIRQYKRKIYYDHKITYRKHTIFELYNRDYYIKDEIIEIFPTTPSNPTKRKRRTEHHLMQSPMLHVHPFDFNIIMPSTKYGNMYFKRGRWKERKKK